ncbi:MAG: P-II family nitrogen regulator [Clostridiales bacterium]|nr:P-II family nitrogen regulator [Clostridiales bacterium]
MSELYLLVTIVDRNQNRNFISFYQDYSIGVIFNTLGKGTADSEILDSFGLEATEKAIQFSIITGEVWKNVKKGLHKEMRIDIPGTGIGFILPLSSIGGKKQLQFLIGGQRFFKKEESILKGTKYELLVMIANQGYTERIMDIARSANASGGTVIHAKGTGMESAEKFLGVSLASEKEIIFSVVRTSDKRKIMQAVMEEAGLKSKAGTILFSLPVTSIAGIRAIEGIEDEEIEQ